MSDVVLAALAGAAEQQPPMHGPILTVAQFEGKHQATKGKLRRYIMCADAGLEEFDGLRDAVLRIGRSVFIAEDRVLAWLSTRAAQPPAPARNPHGRGGKPRGAKQRKRRAK